MWRHLCRCAARRVPPAGQNKKRPLENAPRGAKAWVYILRRCAVKGIPKGRAPLAGILSYRGQPCTRAVYTNKWKDRALL